VVKKRPRHDRQSGGFPGQGNGGDDGRGGKNPLYTNRGQGLASAGRGILSTSVGGEGK